MGLLMLTTVGQAVWIEEEVDEDNDEDEDEDEEEDEEEEEEEDEDEDEDEEEKEVLEVVDMPASSAIALRTPSPFKV